MNISMMQGKPWKTMEEIKVDLPKFFEKNHGVTPVVGFWGYHG
jgi:hypothetical protein